MTDRKGVLILCGDADGNLGDRAILAATCEAIRVHDPETPITVVSRAPERMSDRLGVLAVPPGPRGFWALSRAARRSRLVLIGGGGLFQDDDSLVKMPYWAARCWLARSSCPLVFGHCLGVGPLKSRTGRLAARTAFASMRRISVRDAHARATAQPLTRRTVEVVPDPAFGLSEDLEIDGGELLNRAAVPLDDGPLIGVAVRRWFPPRPRWIPHLVRSRFARAPTRDAASKRLVELWAAALDRVVEATRARIVMMPTYPSESEGDHRLSVQILEAMSSDRGHLVRVDEPRAYRAVAGRLALMVGGRMHPTILAATAGTPVVGVAYNPKFAGAFDLMGIPHRWLDVRSLVEDCDPNPLVELVLDALARTPTFAHRSGDHASPAAPQRARMNELAERTRAWVREVLTVC